MGILDGNYGLDPLQQSMDQFQVQRPPNGPQPGPTGIGIMSALQGKDPTAMMMLASSLLSASGPMPGNPGFGARLGGAVGQAMPQILNQQSIQERTALSKMELQQRQADHQMALDKQNSTRDYALELAKPIEKRISDGTATPEDRAKLDLIHMSVVTQDYGPLLTSFGKAEPQDSPFGKGESGMAAGILADAVKNGVTKDNAVQVATAATIAEKPSVFLNEHGQAVTQKGLDISQIPGAAEAVQQARNILSGNKVPTKPSILSGTTPASPLNIVEAPIGPDSAKYFNDAGENPNPTLTQSQVQKAGYTIRSPEEIKMMLDAKSLVPTFSTTVQAGFGAGAGSGDYSQSIFPPIKGDISSMGGQLGDYVSRKASKAKTAVTAEMQTSGPVYEYNTARETANQALGKLVNGGSLRISQEQLRALEKSWPEPGYTPLPVAINWFNSKRELLMANGLTSGQLDKLGFPKLAAPPKYSDLPPGAVAR